MSSDWYMREHRASLLLFLVGSIVFPALANAQGPGPWWPDPATHRGLAVWVAYSRNYPDMYSDPAFVEQDVAALVQEGVDVVFVAISSSATTPHLQTLSDRTAQFTNDVQSYLNQLNGQGIIACAAVLSDNFTGAPEQLDRFTLVDHLIDFNRGRGPGDAGFTCVATDLEMAAGSRSTAVYDLWKQFHRNMKARIAAGSSDLALLAWMQGPDFLIDRMDDPQDQAALMQRENIAQLPADPALYTGAIRYFTTQDGAAIFDAVIPMWFFTPLGPYMRRLQHNFNELQSLAGEKPFLIAGMMIQNETAGLCCAGCIAGRTEYLARLDFNDTFRVPPFIFIGTGVFKWRIPADWSCGVSTSSTSIATEACVTQ